MRGYLCRGVIGLSTARLLQLRGYRPTIYTQATPSITTTNVAGGLWNRFRSMTANKVTPQFRGGAYAAAAGLYLRLL